MSAKATRRTGGPDPGAGRTTEKGDLTLAAQMADAAEHHLGYEISQILNLTEVRAEQSLRQTRRSRKVVEDACSDVASSIEALAQSRRKLRRVDERLRDDRGMGGD